MAITYCIMCNLTGEKYYGSTKQTLQKRMNGHKCLKINKSLSRQIIERGDYDAYVLGTYETKEEALLKEEYYTRHKECVNKQVVNRSKSEYNKKWKKDNPEKVKEQKKKSDKKYREKNKEKLLQKEKEYRENNKDKMKEYYEKNKEELKRKAREKYKMSK